MGKRSLIVILTVISIVSFSSCDLTIFDTDTGDITGVDLGSDVSVEKDQVDDMNDNSDMDAETEGDDPPNIEGEYITDSLEAVYDYYESTDEEYTYESGEWEFNSYYWKFDNFDKDDLTIEVSYSMVEGYDEASGKKGYIVGDGNEFTVYVDIDGQTTGSYENTINYTFSYVLTGVFDDGEIEDFYFAYVCTDKSGDDYGDFMAVGDMRITYESDGLVEEANYPSRTEGPALNYGNLFKAFQ